MFRKWAPLAGPDTERSSEGGAMRAAARRVSTPNACPAAAAVRAASDMLFDAARSSSCRELHEQIE
jgi:hypothetical protein